MVSTLMGADSPVIATVQAIATDMTARTMGLMSTASGNDVRLEAIAASLGSLTSEVDDQLDAAAAANTAAQATMASTLNATAQSSEVDSPPTPDLRSAFSCHRLPQTGGFMSRFLDEGTDWTAQGSFQRILDRGLDPVLFSCTQWRPRRSQ